MLLFTRNVVVLFFKQKTAYDMRISDWSSDVCSSDRVAAVGGKNASLGERIVALSSAGVRVPSGFATTAAAYREFVSANGLAPDIRSYLEAYRAGKTSLAEAGRAIRGRFLDSAFPSAIADRISAAYEELGERLDRKSTRLNSSH